MALFWIENLSKFSSFLKFSKIFFFLQGECDFYKERKKQKKKNTLCWAENLSNYVSQHNWTDFQLNLGQIFNSTFFTFLALFSFLKICSNPYFYRFSAKITFCSPPPQKLGTLFVNATTLTDVFCLSVFLHFRFFGFLLCPVFWGSFLRGMKKQKKDKIQNKTTRRKEDHKMQTTKPLTVWPEILTLQYLFFGELILALHYILLIANIFWLK